MTKLMLNKWLEMKSETRFIFKHDCLIIIPCCIDYSKRLMVVSIDGISFNSSEFAVIPNTAIANTLI